MSGLELRKAALEVLGWKQGYSQGEHIMVSLDQEHLYLSVCPEIESDPAVSEPMFLEWCVANRYDSAIETAFDGRPSCRVFNRHGHRSVEQLTMQFGDTPSEARARAIVAVGKR